MKVKVIYSVVLLFMLIFVLDNASAVIDLSTVDLQIHDLQVEPIEILRGSSSDLVKINLIFQNIGEEFFVVRGLGQIEIIETDSTLSESEVRTGNKDYISGNFMYTHSEQLLIKYEDPSIGEDCEKLNHTIFPNDSKSLTVCFDIQRENKSVPFNPIGEKNYFLQLNISAKGGCPNCKIIPLFPSVDIAKTEQKIPEWVRNVFIWYGDGLISEDEIINAIQFLITEGIIRI